MKYRTLGTTDIRVSVIAMGCWAIVGDATWGEQEKSESIGALRAAFDHGITFFDTAEAYGEGYSETLVGEALAEVRQDVVIASKVSPQNLSPSALRNSCEASLRRLNTDYIDLYQIHWASREVPMAESVGALQQLKREGKIRAIGVSNFGLEDLTEYLRFDHCETNQLPYNLLWRAIEAEVLPACTESEVGIISYSPLMQGLLTGKFANADEVPSGRARTRHFSSMRPSSRHQEKGAERLTFDTISRIRGISERSGESMASIALSWVLHQKGVNAAVVGARTPAQVERNVKAADVDLSDQVLEELTQASDELKAELGANVDLWQTDSRIR